MSKRLLIEHCAVLFSVKTEIMSFALKNIAVFRFSENFQRSTQILHWQKLILSLVSIQNVQYSVSVDPHLNLYFSNLPFLSLRSFIQSCYLNELVLRILEYSNSLYHSCLYIFLKFKRNEHLQKNLNI